MSISRPTPTPKDSEMCRCLEYEGDSPDCPIHHIHHPQPCEFCGGMGRFDDIPCWKCGGTGVQK